MGLRDLVRRGWGITAITALLGVSSLAACSQQAEPTTRRPAHELGVDFDDLTPGPLAGGSSVGMTGNVGVRASLLTSGTSAEVVDGLGGGTALQIPSSDVGDPDALAVVMVMPQDGDPDPLSPGEAEFFLEADFLISPSASRHGPGHNLVQRGLFADAAQYKLQLDGGIPSCRVSGTAGEVVVSADAAVPSGSWFRVSCQRTPTSLVLRVQSLGAGGPVDEFRVDGSVGSVRLEPTVPMAIGGKLSSEGELVPSSPDQMYGVVDRVRFGVY